MTVRSLWTYWATALLLGFALGHLHDGVDQAIALALLLLHATDMRDEQRGPP